MAKSTRRPVSLKPKQIPVISKDRLLEYAMDAAQVEILTRFPHANFKLEGWVVLLKTIAQKVEVEYDKYTDNGSNPLRVDMKTIRITCNEFAKQMTDAAVADPDMRQQCGIQLN